MGNATAPMPPWGKYCVAHPGTAGWGRLPLETVSHVTHVPIACRIVEDGRLRADLVDDESKLNTQRIRVVWLSPNDWRPVGGFRYGNVRFRYDWRAIIEGKRAFWVEDIAYGIPACRILLTGKDYSGLLDPYDPGSCDGPWIRTPAGEHLWNGKFALEVLLEEDVDLHSALCVDFVAHHEFRCNIDKHGCRYRGRMAQRGGAEFIAAAISRGLRIDLPGMTETEEKSGVRVPSPGVLAATWWILAEARRLPVGGSLVAGDESAIAAARAFLGACANASPLTRASDRSQLASLFRSVDDLNEAVCSVIATALDLPGAASLMWFTDDRRPAAVSQSDAAPAVVTAASTPGATPSPERAAVARCDTTASESELGNWAMDLAQEGYTEILDDDAALQPGQFRRTARADLENSEMVFGLEWIARGDA